MQGAYKLVNDEQEIYNKLITRISRYTGLDSTKIIRANKNIAFPLGNFCSINILNTTSNGGWFNTENGKVIEQIATISIQVFREGCHDLLTKLKIGVTSGLDDFFKSDDIAFLDFGTETDTSYLDKAEWIERYSTTAKIVFKQELRYNKYKVVSTDIDQEKVD